MFWKKEKKVHNLMDNYMKAVLECMEAFQECVLLLLEDSTSEQAKELVKKVDDAESHADKLRDKIEFRLYKKALMPEARGDMLALIEAVDRIPNWAEEVVYDIHLQRVKFPEHLLGQFRQLVIMNIECFRLLSQAIDALFNDIDSVFELTKKVDAKESEIDEFERELIREVFDIEERLSYHNLLHRVIRSICDMSDKTENVSDRLTIITIKKLI